jgi:hypothetical protein
MNQARATLFVVLALLLAGFLVACSQSAVRLGWVEASSPGHVEASYAKFTGTETRTVLAQAGGTLYLEYKAEVEAGDLCLEVKDPFGKTIWHATFCEDCAETKALPVDEDGCYTIFVEGEDATGNFDLAWSQR